VLINDKLRRTCSLTSTVSMYLSTSIFEKLICRIDCDSISTYNLDSVTQDLKSGEKLVHGRLHYLYVSIICIRGLKDRNRSCNLDKDFSTFFL
jgi:hypothetical protein